MKSQQKNYDTPEQTTAVLVKDDDQPSPSGRADPVLAALGQAAQRYRAVQALWERDVAELQQAREELAGAREERREVLEELDRTRALLDRERQLASRHRERARQLAAALKDIHRALFRGNVFELILRACTTLTGATRGLYLATGEDGQVQVRAAIDFDGYPRKPPSDWLRAASARVRADEKSLVCNGSDCPADLPRPDENLRNFLVAPVVLLKRFGGVVVLADKPGAGFDQEDVDLVLSVGDQAGVALENELLQRQLLEVYFSVVGVLADAMEAKDPYTQGHCEMVSRYSRLTAERLGASLQERSTACYGGLLHDIGKIGVSDGVLNKPGALLPEEWDLMRSHVRIGRDLLAHVPALDGVADVVLHHHERYDGGGYPDGLRAEQISLTARIVCVVDAYCAMTAKRSYKESFTQEEAREELIRCKATHFDPQVVDALLAVLDDPGTDDGAADGRGLLPHPEEAGDFQHVLHNGPGRKA